MRLIDVDLYCATICKCNRRECDKAKCPIHNAPTAYDVDKVVEELESFAKLAEDRWTNGTSKHAYQEHKCWVKAIEIVKNGGVSDDLCEWKVKSNYYVTECSHDTDVMYGLKQDFKFCPYCGKKIKVVEQWRD